MPNAIRRNLLRTITGCIERIPEGEHYPPHKGTDRIIALKSATGLTVVRDDVTGSGDKTWETRVGVVGNLAVNPPELETVSYSQKVRDRVVHEFELPVDQIQGIDLSKVMITIRAASQTIRHMQS